MKILILNAGSSSLKYQLIDMEGEKLLAKGICERIGIEGSKLKQNVNGQAYERIAPMKDHTAAIQLMLEALTGDKGALSSMDEIGAVGHRVLHGGERFTASVLINEEVKEAISANITLGPLHNPANLMGIEACEKVMPATPQCGDVLPGMAFPPGTCPRSVFLTIPKECRAAAHPPLRLPRHHHRNCQQAGPAPSLARTY